MASEENRTETAGVSLPCHSVYYVEVVCSEVPSHRSQSYWGPRQVNRPWSKRLDPLEGGRAVPEEVVDSERSRNTIPQRASADPRMSSVPGRYLKKEFHDLCQQQQCRV